MERRKPRSPWTSSKDYRDRKTANTLLSPGKLQHAVMDVHVWLYPLLYIYNVDSFVKIIEF